MTVERKVLFPNVLVEVFNQGHLDAVFRVADHLGYVLSISCVVINNEKGINYGWSYLGC